jgi:hypothetical protein
MTEEQLSALLAKLEQTAGFSGQCQDSDILDAAEATALEAGFDLGKMMSYGSAVEHEELAENELEMVAGGRWANGCGGWSGGGSNPCVWVY